MLKTNECRNQIFLKKRITLIKTRKCKIITSLGSLPQSSLNIFFSFMSDQNIVPVCIFDVVATTFSTITGTLSKLCSCRSAITIECRFEIIKNAAL